MDPENPQCDSFLKLHQLAFHPHGAGSELHGYRNWGSETPELPSRVLTERGRFPDIFYLLHTQKPETKTGLVYTWKTIETCVDTEGLTCNRFIEKDDFDAATQTFLEFLDSNPTLAFVYYSEPDSSGHNQGWGSDAYHTAVQKLDVQLRKIVEYLEANDRMKDTLVISFSDHGGTEKGHGRHLPHGDPLFFTERVFTGKIRERS